MYFAKLLTAIIFSITSLFMAAFSIIKINSLPSSRFSEKGNYGRIAIYSSVSSFLDIIMTIIIIFFCGEGEFGTGYELIVSLCVLLLYTPWCISSSHKLKKRMSNFGKIDVKYLNALNYTVFFKVIFAFFTTIFFVECRM